MIFFKVLPKFYLQRGVCWFNILFFFSSSDSIIVSWVWLISVYRHQKIVQIFLRMYNVFVRRIKFIELDIGNIIGIYK